MADDTSRSKRIKHASADRRVRQKAGVREAILVAATELFLAGGYEGFSLRRVAERVGYTPTTVYLYFADKDDLLFTVARQGFEGFSEALRAGFASTSHPIDRIEAIGRAYIAFGTTYPAYYRLMFMERTEFLTRSHPEHHKPVIEAFTILVRAVEVASATGHLAPGDVQTHSDVLWAGLHGITSLKITMPFLNDDRIRTMVDLYFQAFRHGVARTPRGDP